MNFATPFNIDPKKWSDATALNCKDKTLAQQQFKDECDINVLMGRYLETGEMPQLDSALSYGDFTGVYDFQTAMNAVRTAQGLFEQMPARIKNRFANDPQRLLEFLNDPENLEEAQFLGLISKTPSEPAPATPTAGIPQGTQPAPAPTPTPGNPGGTTQPAPAAPVMNKQ